MKDGHKKHFAGDPPEPLAVQIGAGPPVFHSGLRLRGSDEIISFSP